MFGYVKLIKNTDPYKYSYSGYGNGFDSHSIFSLPNFDWGKNVIGVNISFSVDVDNIYLNIYVIYIYINSWWMTNPTIRQYCTNSRN